MGVVHLALDPEGRQVAVKVLRGTEGVNARRRLAREVETMRRVRSPYVAEVLDADLAGEHPYIVTRYVNGDTLEKLVRSRGRCPRRACAGWPTARRRPFRPSTRRAWCTAT
jgi:serine/threonine protein kinase